MQRVQNDCVDCGLPCLGSSCPLRNVVHHYCDCCGEEEQLYEFEGEELCQDCIENKYSAVDVAALEEVK